MPRAEPTSANPLSAFFAVFGYIGEIVLIVGAVVSQLTLRLSTLRAATLAVLGKQVQFTGLDAVPFAGVLAMFTALSVVAQIQLVGLGQSELFGKLMVVVMVRELGPIIVALVVLARSGTAVATEMATMRVAGEVETLEKRGIDPFSYLVVPRLGGMAVSLFCLAQVFIFIAIVGGFILSRLIVPDAPVFGEYVRLITSQLDWLDALVLLAKTLVPGLLIGAIACREGLACGSTYTDVPRATTRAVVRSFIAVFCWNALVTTLIYVLTK
jgi:phospholipid/cholesterol/gamma-HCH transport system permease protein